MKVTVVVDNSVPISSAGPFLGEHGYSLLIEIDSAKVLLDAGQTSAAVHNLSLLGIHPDELDAIVLSHGHYDHAGGLAFILKERHKPVSIYAHRDIFNSRYSLGREREYIGIPNTQEELSELGAQWQLTVDPVEIVPGLLFSGQIPRCTHYETGDKKLVIASASGCDCQDPISDDASLYYSGPKGLVVLSGCAHAGLVNTVEHGFKLTGKTQLNGWIGGTHLGPAIKEQQEKTLHQLKEYNPRLIAASHCTGFYMMAELQKMFGERFVTGFVSRVIKVE